jgi:hypothetical protein
MSEKDEHGRYSFASVRRVSIRWIPETRELAIPEGTALAYDSPSRWPKKPATPSNHPTPIIGSDVRQGCPRTPWSGDLTNSVPQRLPVEGMSDDEFACSQRGLGSFHSFQ